MAARQLIHKVLSLNPEYEAEFLKIVCEIFSDSIRYWGCIAVIFAFAIFLQQRFKINLEKETETLTEDILFDWMEVQEGWNEAASDVGNGFLLSFIHYLIRATCLLLLLDNCRLH